MRDHQLTGAVALAALLALAVTGCSDAGEWLSPSPTPSGPGTGTASGAPEAVDSALPGLPAPAQGRALLGELTVAEEGSMAGYSREEFPHWISEDGCTSRQRVLARDGEGVETDEDCQPVAGTWFSAFDGETLTEAADLDIDHIVPLAAAWRSGADAWDEDTRREFANDLRHPQLIAVSASSNRSKGDQTPADWRPVEGFWCSYGLAWTSVKHTYGLTVTEEEAEALGEMLDACPAP